MAFGGHSFGKKTFHKPTYCHHCSDLLWGLIGQGYICEGSLIISLILLLTFLNYRWCDVDTEKNKKILTKIYGTKNCKKEKKKNI